MYNEIICEHFMNPRNVGEFTDYDYAVEISNPICGDTFHIYMKVNGEVIEQLNYRAYGCSGSIATASIVSEKVIGLTFSELNTFTVEEIKDWLGELEPAHMHCIDLGLAMIERCAEPQKYPLEKKEYLVEEEV
jgi:NifU-like protein involved in Fe-S cluster formation